MPGVPVGRLVRLSREKMGVMASSNVTSVLSSVMVPAGVRITTTVPCRAAQNGRGGTRWTDSAAAPPTVAMGSEWHGLRCRRMPQELMRG